MCSRSRWPKSRCYSARASSRRAHWPRRPSPITSGLAPRSWLIRNGRRSMHALRRCRRCGFCRGRARRLAARHPDIDQGSLRAFELSDLCRLAQTPTAEIRGRWSGGGEPASAIGDRHGQDAHGRVRLWRHRPQRALWQSAQSLGRQGASLARRLVQRRGCLALRRLGALGFWQRHGGLGSPARVDDRQCRVEVHRRPLADRRHRAAELHLRHARDSRAQHGGCGVQLCRARSAAGRRLCVFAPCSEGRRRNSDRACRFLVLGRLRKWHRRSVRSQPSTGLLAPAPW